MLDGPFRGIEALANGLLTRTSCTAVASVGFSRTSTSPPDCPSTSGYVPEPRTCWSATVPEPSPATPPPTCWELTAHSADRDRDTTLAGDGWETRRFGADDLDALPQTVDRIRRLLDRRTP